MRIITINVNGIRAAERKGFFSWLEKQNADVVCLQEIKAQEDQLDERFYPAGMIPTTIVLRERATAEQASIANRNPIELLIVHGKISIQKVGLFKLTLEI